MKDSMSESNTKTELKSEIKAEVTQNEDIKPGIQKIIANPQIKIKTEYIKCKCQCNAVKKEEPLDMPPEMKVENVENEASNIENDVKQEDMPIQESEYRNVNNSLDTTNVNSTQDVKLECDKENTRSNDISNESDKNESDGRFKPVKRKRGRIRSRNHRRSKKAKYVVKSETTTETELEPINSPELLTSKEYDVEYCLTVTNLPNNWSFLDIKNYIDTQCGPVDEIEMLKDDKTGNGAIRLSYQTEDECRKAMQKLKDKEIEGTRLVLEMSVASIESDTETQPETTEPTQPEAPEPSTKPWRPDLDVWEIDPEGLYGLKPAFLKSLGIIAPLDKWVHVSNFRCDKSELRDVLDMAGNVLMCSIFNDPPKYANVMYSHPLEAVQAVSMLNGQMFYGQVLKVDMDRSPVNTILLPKGLSTIGQGLGGNGKPLRNILKHYHRFVTNQKSSINRVAFNVPENLESTNHSLEDEVPFMVKSVEEFNYALPTTSETSTVAAKTTTIVTKSPVTTTQAKPASVTPVRPPQPVQRPPFVQTPSRSPVPRQPFQAQTFQPRNNFGPNFGVYPPGPRPFGPDPRMVRPFGPGPGPGWVGPAPVGPISGPMSGSMARPMGPMPGPMSAPMGLPQGPIKPQMYSGNEPVQLQLSNLPPSTTFYILCEKMAQCGQVVSIQLTTPGCAVVTFANRPQADRCFQLYNGACIEGFVMQVKYS